MEIAGAFARFAEDPWVDGKFAREPLTDEVDVAIVGAGFGGLLTGARLRELGVESVRLIDRAADVGGTWYWNRYPGIACDVESYVYMPLLEELGYIPTDKYAKGAEIFAHCRRIAEHYDLYRDACLQTDVHEIRWDSARFPLDHSDEPRRRDAGQVRLHGQRISGQAQAARASPASAVFAGRLSIPAGGTTATPARSWRTWPDKRVGIIGTGATAVQCVPHLAAAAQHLYVFQRTPSSVDVRANRPTDPQWANTLRPGWQRERIRELSDPDGRRAGRGRSGRRCLDEHHPEASGHAP